MKYIKQIDVIFTSGIFLKEELQNLISRGFNEFAFLKESNKSSSGPTVWIIVAYETTSRKTNRRKK